MDQDRVHPEWAQTKSLHLTLLPKIGQLGACQMSNIFPLSQGDNTTFIQLFEVGDWAAALYQLADGSAMLKLGLDGILDGISRVSTYHGSHIGCQFLVAGFTSPFAGRWLKHWAHGKCRLKTQQWQLWFGKRWCLFSMGVSVGNPQTKLHTMLRYKQISGTRNKWEGKIKDSTINKSRS